MTTTIAKLAVEALIANGITQLYCLPGVQNDHFFNALFDHTDAITPIQTRHEQGAAYMATGAALVIDPAGAVSGSVQASPRQVRHLPVQQPQVATEPRGWGAISRPTLPCRGHGGGPSAPARTSMASSGLLEGGGGGGSLP